MLPSDILYYIFDLLYIICFPINGHEFEKAPEEGERQGSLASCNPQGRRVGHDWETELNWTEELAQFDIEGTSKRLESLPFFE